jgi:hypothetical protein
MVFFQNKKKTIWVNLGGPWNGHLEYKLQPFGTFSGHLVI